MSKIMIAGAGVTGATIACALIELDNRHEVEVYDSRDHVAGNCHTVVDEETGVLEHVYGPHIFHTSDRSVWSFVNKYQTFDTYEHRVKTISSDQVFSMPINLHTISQVYGRAMNPAEARAAVHEDCIHYADPKNFEEMALSTVGNKLYERFFEGYTVKQWGRDPSELPASVAARLPVRFNHDDRYFSDTYQALPANGYTDMVQNMLNNPRITVHLNTTVTPDPPDGAVKTGGYDKLIWTGPIDAYFGYDLGRLPYRTLDFTRDVADADEATGCAVMNYADFDIEQTRTTDFGRLSPHPVESGQTVLYDETPREAEEGDIPYYPVRLAEGQEMLGEYQIRASKLKDVIFAGRLGTYRYLDMAPAIGEALKLGRELLEELR